MKELTKKQAEVLNQWCTFDIDYEALRKEFSDIIVKVLMGIDEDDKYYAKLASMDFELGESKPVDLLIMAIMRDKSKERYREACNCFFGYNLFGR